jgi:hypothetical protein
MNQPAAAMSCAGRPSRFGCGRRYFFCKFVHILPLDGPTNVPVFMHDARAVSQLAAMLGWLAPADPLQFAAASLHEVALAGAMLPKSSSAIIGFKIRMA